MIKVNEVFGPTIQGEGKSLGREVFFLRLANCNLSCVWCDSKHSWDWKNYDKEKEIHPMSVDDIISKLKSLGDIKSLVVSGGEPLLQQKELISLFEKLKEDGWWIEIETNGTIEPTTRIVELLDQINCSPKLSNSNDSKRRRLKQDSLLKISKIDKAYFKFVVGSTLDVEEIREIVSDFRISKEKVFLMPLGLSREELEKTKELVEQTALSCGFLFSPRLHIELFGTKRGV